MMTTSADIPTETEAADDELRADARRTWTCFAILAAALFVGYADSLPGAFVFDDNRNIVHNRSVRRFFGPVEDIPVSLHHRAICRLTFAWNYKLGGLNVVGYHLTNILIHGGAGWLLFLLIRDSLRLEGTRRALGLPESGWRSVTTHLAFAVTLLWLVHPIQTQAVTYISQRLESLMSLFFLATMYCVLRGSTAVRSWAWYALASAMMALAVGTKEVAVMALPVTLLFDRIFLAGSWHEVRQRRGWMYASFLLPIAWLGWELATFHPATRNAGIYYVGVSKWEYLSTQPQVILHYLGLVFWPKTLCLDYGWPIARTAAEIYPAGLLILALVVTSFALLYYSPRIGFFGTTFFLILAPTSSVIPIADLVYDHRMYLPLATVILLLTVAGWKFWQRWQMVDPVRDARHEQQRRLCGYLLLVAVAAPLEARTIVRNLDFRSDLAIWQATLAVRPNHSRAWYNVGYALSNEGKNEEALEHLNRSLKLRPDYVLALYSRAVTLDRLGRTEEGVRDMSRVLELEPDNASALAARGTLYLKLGQLEAAERDLTRQIVLEPRYVPTYVKRGVIYRKLKQPEKAEADFSKAIELNPKHGHGYYHRCKLLLQQRRTAEAEKDLAKLLEIAPDAGETIALQGDVHRVKGDLELANKEYQQALQLKSDDPALHEGFAAVLIDQKKFAEARREMELCKKLGGKPDEALVSRLEKEARDADK